MSSDAGDADAFFSLLTEVGVPQELQTALSDAGMVSVADFAYSYISTADLSSFIQNQPTQLWTTLLGLQTQSTALQQPDFAEHSTNAKPLQRRQT